MLYTTAKSPGSQLSRLLVSRDGGATFDVGLELPEIRGAAFSADRRLWVSARHGLYSSADPFALWELVPTATELGCVTEQGEDLLVCGHYAGVGAPGFGIGSSADGGLHFSPWLDFGSVTSPVACAEGSATALLCAQPWLDWSIEMLAPAPDQPMNAPSGPLPAPGDREATRVPDDALETGSPEAASAACSLPHGAHAKRSAWLALLALLWLARAACRAGGHGRGTPCF